MLQHTKRKSTSETGRARGEGEAEAGTQGEVTVKYDGHEAAHLLSNSMMFCLCQRECMCEVGMSTSRGVYKI